eukprot:280484_1
MGNVSTHNKGCIVMSGLKYAGKSTILVEARLGTIQNMQHGMGFYSKKVIYSGYELNVWNDGDIFKSFSDDVWKIHRNTNTKALIWVVDSSANDKINESYKALHQVLSYPELKHIRVLILANKQDKSNALSVDEMEQRMGMIQYGKITYASLKRVQNMSGKTYLDYVSDDIIELISQYVLYKRIKPYRMKMITMNDLNIKGLIYDNNSIEHSDTNRICKLICSYLPPYDYIKGVQSKCAVFGCCAIRQGSLNDSLNWLEEALQQNDNACKFM